MLTANNVLLSSQTAASGSWRNIQNWINFSLQIDGLEGNVWVEASNNPNVLTNGANISSPAAPVLTQYTPTSNSHIAGVPVNTTYYVKNTYVTPNSFNPTGSAPVFTTAGLGETLPSTESSLLVLAGNLLVVQPPAQDTNKVAIGWNTYISTATNKETLQNLESNAVIAPRTFGQSFIATNWGLSTAGSAVPVSNTSTTAASGVNITGNLVGATASSILALGLDQMQIVVSGTQAMINPSGICFNFIRVCKSGGGSVQTTCYLFGQSA